MKTSALLASIALLLSGPMARADTVETTSGARIVGKVTRIDAGSVTVDTDYAGTLAVKQSAISRITTDAPVAIRLQSGTRVDGRISSSAAGALEITGADAVVHPQVSDLSQVWSVGEADPQAGRWSYEASADLSGKTGNKEQLGTSAALRAVHRSIRDTLQFYGAYDRQVTDHQRAADQLKAGIDYQNNFAGRTSWYVRDEGGFDRVKDIQFYNIAATGMGFDLFRQPKHLLTARVGLSYRHEGYRNPASADVNSAGLDVGLNHELELPNSKLVTRIAYVPSFGDFGDYRLTHETFWEMPIAASAWKLRTGVSNDYTSHPTPGVERMDTTYFSRLALTWQ